MSGARLCSLLFELGYEGYESLDPDSCEWPFQYDDVRPVLDWLCSSLRPSNVLSSTEVSLYKQFLEEGKLLEKEWREQRDNFKVKKFRSSSSFQKDENDEMAEALNELSRNSSPNFLCSMCSKELLTTQDAASKGMHGIPEVLVGGEFPQSNGKSLDVNSDHLATQRLKSSMEQLHEELERMKTGNTHFLRDGDFDFQVLQEELVQLHRVNNELRSMFPLFDEISISGNALERVLAMEIELAESLKAKNKSNVHFQSSFLKQHGGEEAVFKSFRDINELIKQMLEIKGRHAAVEAELREMHDRYSQLSLQFAEVEGEKQKLKMMLKNARASKKLESPSRS